MRLLSGIITSRNSTPIQGVVVELYKDGMLLDTVNRTSVDGGYIFSVPDTFSGIVRVPDQTIANLKISGNFAFVDKSVTSVNVVVGVTEYDLMDTNFDGIVLVDELKDVVELQAKELAGIHEELASLRKMFWNSLTELTSKINAK